MMKTEHFKALWEADIRRRLLRTAVVSAGVLSLVACGGGNDSAVAESSALGSKFALVKKDPRGKGVTKSPKDPIPPPTSTGTATVTWAPPTLNTDGSTLTDLAGYRIYYGTSSATLTQVVDVSGATVTSQIISGLSSGTYYFAVAAVDSAGIASGLTNAASVTIP
jgi:hypothetical protein